MVSQWYMLCPYVYGLQQYVQLNNSYTLYFLFLYFKQKIGKRIDFAAVFN